MKTDEASIHPKIQKMNSKIKEKQRNNKHKNLKQKPYKREGFTKYGSQNSFKEVQKVKTISIIILKWYTVNHCIMTVRLAVKKEKKSFLLKGVTDEAVKINHLINSPYQINILCEKNEGIINISVANQRGKALCDWVAHRSR